MRNKKVTDTKWRKVAELYYLEGLPLGKAYQKAGFKGSNNFSKRFREHPAVKEFEKEWLGEREHIRERDLGRIERQLAWIEQSLTSGVVLENHDRLLNSFWKGLRLKAELMGFLSKLGTKDEPINVTHTGGFTISWDIDNGASTDIDEDKNTV